MPKIEKMLENQELSAELLLSTFYQDVKEWNAVYGSFFSRNYSGDLKSVNSETNTVALSRNGLYDILPEKMFFDVEELRFRESRDFALRVSEIYEEEKNIKDYFLPLDSFFFNQSLRIHKVSGRMEDDRIAVLLKTLFDYDIEAETNPFIRLLAPLLLHVAELRADLNALSNILCEILGCQVDYSVNHQDDVLFVVNKPNLTSREYIAYMRLLKPLFDFVGFWFVPMEMDCHYKVKDHQQRFVLSFERPLVLDYNTQV